MRELLRRNNLNYTYRLLILPETIGSVAWLQERAKSQELRTKNQESSAPSLFGGLFLEMLGTDLPHSLQLSLQGDTPLDKLMMNVVQAHDTASWVGAFNTVIGNDERQFNAPGIRVPMLSLSRVHQPNHPHYPYLQYHSTDDTPAIVSAERLDASAALVLKIIDGIESSPIPHPPSPTPTPNYKGEVFLSRYGIHIDPTEDPEGRRHLFKVMNLIDGTRSIEQIAATSAAPVDAVQRIVGLLQQHGLVAL